MNNMWGGSHGSLYYDALKNISRRRTRLDRVKSSDEKLWDRDRAALSARAASSVENFSIAAWMVRTHVNHTAAINFQSTTGNGAFDKAAEDWYAKWAKRTKCHTQRKHGFRDLLRMIEGRRTCDGDVFILRVGGRSNLRGSIQLIEADRIRNPDGHGEQNTIKPPGWVNGVYVTPNGIATSYALHDRQKEGHYIYSQSLSAFTTGHHGFFDRPDQLRGVSPLVQALNTMQDLYEGFEYTQGKLKLAQLFGAFITRDADLGLGGTPTQDTNADGYADSDFEMSVSDGPLVTDLGVGEKIEVVQDKSNSHNAIPFLEMMTQVSLKALDLPYSFFREDFSNWFGSRAANIHFERSAKPKRMQLMDTADEIIQWALGIAIIDGELELPGKMTFEDLSWDWVPEAFGWYDPVAEVTAARASVAAGFDSIDNVCRRIGTDPVENLKSRAKYEKMADKLGLKGGLDFAMGSSSSAALVAEPEDAEGAKEKPVSDNESEGEDDDSSDDERRNERDAVSSRRT